jgi:DNA-binding response OmpR family regulator
MILSCLTWACLIMRARPAEGSQKSNPEAACIILTARAEVTDRIKGLDLGADDYLPNHFRC